MLFNLNSVMNCLDLCCVPVIYLYRLLIWMCPCMFNIRYSSYEPFDIQLQNNKCREGVGSVMITKALFQRAILFTLLLVSNCAIKAVSKP